MIRQTTFRTRSTNGRILNGCILLSGVVTPEVLRYDRFCLLNGMKVCRGPAMTMTQTIPSKPLAQPAKAAAASMSPRTRAMLEGAIVPTLLRLVAGNVGILVAQAVITFMETYYISWLGADALAGATLAFPLITLMQTMSGAGIGGGVASAIARSLGAGRREMADALALHAIVLALLLGAGFTAAELLGGAALFRAMGATGGALQAAITYGGVFFAGVSALWLFNMLASIVRGAGIVRLPAMVSLSGAIATVSLSPILIMGWGPFPRLGIAGAALATLTFYAGATIILGAYLLSGRMPIKPLRRVQLEGQLFREILRVGLPATLNTILNNGTLLLLAALVAPFGTQAMAGYGIGARLEMMQIPVVASFGTALIAIVGTNIGADNRARAARIAWMGTGMAACVCGAFGLFGVLAPHLWISIFSGNAAVLDAGTRYLRTVGPAFAFFGIGATLFWAALGAARPFWPLACAFARLVTAVGGGAVAGYALHGGLDAIYGAIVLGLIVYGGGTALALRLRAW
jgi:putative MATE family efflux protein